MLALALLADECSSVSLPDPCPPWPASALQVDECGSMSRELCAGEQVDVDLKRVAAYLRAPLHNDVHATVLCSKNMDLDNVGAERPAADEDIAFR